MLAFVLAARLKAKPIEHALCGGKKRGFFFIWVVFTRTSKSMAVKMVVVSGLGKGGVVGWYNRLKRAAKDGGFHHLGL